MTDDELINAAWAEHTSEGMSGGELHFAQTLVRMTRDALVEDHQRYATNARYLADKARNLVTLLDDAEVNHGGLWSGKTMRARDDLRQELARWR